MSLLQAVAAVVIAACVVDCAAERTQIANYAQNKMVGLTKEQVLACMGSPASKATEGAILIGSFDSCEHALPTSSLPPPECYAMTA